LSGQRRNIVAASLCEAFRAARRAVAKGAGNRAIPRTVTCDNLVSFECRLDPGAIFYFNRNVPADDSRARLRTTNSNTQSGAAAFVTTHWSVVLAAQGPSPAAKEALEKLCRTYWRSIYGFVRRQGAGPEEAEDLTQGFFALLLERRDFDSVRKEKGRLRSYLLTSLKHFLTNERHCAMAIKRGEGQQLIPLEDLRERERAGFESTDTSTADQIYERRWALTVLDQVLARLGDEYRAVGNMRLFDRLQKSLMDEPDRPSQADTAHEFGNDRERGEAGTSPVTSALPATLTRGNRSYGYGPGRYRG
jgi:RNA polymerase sigma factor (sigma-70 family)